MKVIDALKLARDALLSDAKEAHRSVAPPGVGTCDICSCGLFTGSGRTDKCIALARIDSEIERLEAAEEKIPEDRLPWPSEGSPSRGDVYFHLQSGHAYEVAHCGLNAKDARQAVVSYRRLENGELDHYWHRPLEEFRGVKFRLAGKDEAKSVRDNLLKAGSRLIDVYRHRHREQAPLIRRERGFGYCSMLPDPSYVSSSGEIVLETDEYLIVLTTDETEEYAERLLGYAEQQRTGSKKERS